MQVAYIAAGVFAAMLLAVAVKADLNRAIVVCSNWFVGDVAPVYRGLMVPDFHCSVFDIVSGALVLNAGDHDCKLDGGTLVPDNLFFDATPRHAVHDAIYLKSDDMAREWAFAGWTGERVREFADDVATCVGRELANEQKSAMRRSLARGTNRVIHFFTALLGETAHAWYAGGPVAGFAALRGARLRLSPDFGACHVSRDRLAYVIRKLEG